MEIITFILILLLFISPLILGLFLFQTFFVLFNSDQFKTSSHSQKSELEMTIVKKIKRQETNPLSIAALANPMTLPMFFAWPKDEKFAVQFENNVTIAVKEKDFNSLEENQKCKILKTVTRTFYSRKWYEKPLLLNLILSKDDRLKDEYEEITTRHQIIS